MGDDSNRAYKLVSYVQKVLPCSDPLVMTYAAKIFGTFVKSWFVFSFKLVIGCLWTMIAYSGPVSHLNGFVSTLKSSPVLQGRESHA